MPTNIFRGDAPPVERVYRLLAPPEPEVQINLSVGNKEMTFDYWDAAGIVQKWNASTYAEMREITASVDGETGDILFTRDGDFRITATVGAYISITTIQQGVAPVNQKIKLELPSSVTGGTWNLTINWGTGNQSYNSIPWNVSAATLQAGIISNMAGASSGDVLVLETAAHTYELTIQGSYAGSNVIVTADGANLTGSGAGTVTVIQEPGHDTPECWYIPIPEDGDTSDGGSLDPGGVNVTTPAGSFFSNDGNNIANLQAACVAAGMNSGDLTITEMTSTFTSKKHLFLVIEGDSREINITSIWSRAGLTQWNGVKVQEKYGLINNTFYFHDGGESSPDVHFDAESTIGSDTVAGMQSALTGLTSIGSGNVLLYGWNNSGDPASGGGASTGDGYIIRFQNDLGNADILVSRFSGSDGTFTKVHAGKSPANEIQRVKITSGTGGNLKLTFDGQQTGNIAYSATALAMVTGLEALSNIGSGDVSVVKSGEAQWDVEFKGQYAGDNVSLMELDVTGITGGTVVVTITQNGVQGQNEKQLIQLADSTSGGTFQLKLYNSASGVISYDDDATEFETALVVIPQLTESNIGVLEVGPGAWSVEFITTLAKQAIPEFEVYKNNLTSSGSISLELEVEGYGPNWWTDAKNWTLSRIPHTGDDVVIDRKDVDILWGIAQFCDFAAVVADDTLSAPEHKLHDGQKVIVTSTTTLPTGLDGETEYYVINADRFNGTLQLATTEGGSAVSITDLGEGTHTVGVRLNSFTQRSSFNGKLGLARFTTGKFYEYRPQFLQIGFQGDRKIVIGSEEGSGSGRTNLDFKRDQVFLFVLDTGGPVESDVPPLLIKTNNAATEITVHNAEVGIGFYPEDSFEFGLLQGRGGSIRMGKGILHVGIDSIGTDILGEEVTYATDGYFILRSA
ncbi:MAG: hypothetical protein CMJ46_16190 [Planctomyces sp.]|nr:hypothetical protein [Planctomyces sp.]